MRRSPRLRKALKWTGLVLSVLLLIVWVGSWWCIVRRQQFSSRCIEWQVGSGLISFTLTDTPFSAAMVQEFPPTLQFRRLPNPRVRWFFERMSVPMAGMTVDRTSVPLWIPLAVMAVPTALLWLSDRRLSKFGLCKKCGYDIRGLQTCPECGVGADPTSSES